MQALSPYRQLVRSAPRLRPRQNPRIRAALAAAVIAMLPFAWSEDVSCDGKPQRVLTGLEILFGHQYDAVAPGLVFFALVIVSVALGFAARTERPLRRLAAELGASIAAAGTFTMTALMMRHGRAAQPLDHPAAWIGTLAALGIALQSWFLSGAALRKVLESWRMRSARRRRSADAGAARERLEGRARFASHEGDARGRDGREEAEREAEAACEPLAARRGALARRA